ncbi:carbohydrate-binding protein SusD [Niastella koreensis]|uniref:RagB/SusD domain-containing protein n=2 Tax=Niastella koreensis TaxID=354356 RepID=G8TCQ3_NIAKG|nr:RagB/SusD family nutrient uptake outer membrane protein [Niastella koreensis]AEW03507.1 RagB/SusD domain-containing protein [Niastella koreensis GR20-10]OQP53867.1 carbohydrate-binding protein SusD [Niastella koreensis]
MKKRLIYIVASLMAAGVMVSCHKVTVKATTELTPDVYPQDSASFISASGPAYVALRGNVAAEYFFQQTYSTDEGIMPARGGNWYDGGQNMEMHYHTWTRDNGYLNGNWYWLSTIIGVVNQELSILGKTQPAGTAKDRNLAELKMVRALAYYFMMDNWGNVPIDTVYGDFAPRDKSPRADVFNFIESEVKAAIPLLSTDVNASTYGRFTQYGAYALLAKMYLNAEYYIGTKKYNECIAACDNVINSNKYSITNRATYLQSFYPANGPLSAGSKDEFIFAIPYDPTFTNTFPFRSNNYHARYDVPRSMGKVAAGAGYNYFGIPYTPGAPASTLPEFYAYFNDAGDIRNKQWLVGKQTLPDGVTPLTITTTKAGYDAITYAGDNTPYTYQLDLTPNIVLRQSSTSFDCGNDEVAWNMGYRNIKFYPDATSATRDQNNDIPIFRYSDIILMKSEAILRGGTATLGATALSLANDLRAKRTTTAPWATITLDSIYNERSREFAWEAWHRNDMIRYGKYEGKWGFKTNADAYRRIFPIPTNAFAVNPKLTQNTGY